MDIVGCGTHILNFGINMQIDVGFKKQQKFQNQGPLAFNIQAIIMISSFCLYPSEMMSFHKMLELLL